MNAGSSTVIFGEGYHNASIRISGSHSLNNISFDHPDPSCCVSYTATFDPGTVLTASGTLYMSGYQPFILNGGTLAALGDVTVGGASSISGTTFLRCSGNATQNFVLTGSNDVMDLQTALYKDAGEVILLSSFTADNSGQDLSITSGTLSLNGYNLSVNDQLVIGSSGTLQLQGVETLTAGTKVMNSSATVVFTGIVDFSEDTINFTRYFTTYENLTFDTGGGLGLPDIFTSTANVTINDDLTINSGVMYLNGFNLTANAARTTFSNNATVRLNGDEIISNLTQDTNNGIWEYVGTGGPYTIKDFGGGTDYYAMIINGSGATFNLGASLKQSLSHVHARGPHQSSHAISESLKKNSYRPENKPKTAELYISVKYLFCIFQFAH
jgi:hypothetical protein